MQTSPHYTNDLLFFFSGKPLEQSLYEALFHQMESRFPHSSVKVQKTQITFYDRRLFAAVSLPARRKKGWPEHCLLVTFGLSYQKDSPRIAVATEPYPNRWTHHVPLSREEEIDGELLYWLEESHAFSQSKR